MHDICKFIHRRDIPRPSPRSNDTEYDTVCMFVRKVFKLVYPNTRLSIVLAVYDVNKKNRNV